MKKTFTLMAGLCFSGLALQAQITINQSAYATWTPGVDSIRELNAATVVPAANASWDLSGSFYGMNDAHRYIAGTSAAFSGATYYTNGVMEIVPASGLELDIKHYRGNTAQGIRTMGFSVDRTAFSLAAATLSPNDSLVFEAQNVVYTSPETHLAFPATSTSVWSSNLTATTNFKLSVAFLSMVNTPGSIRKHIVTTDSVKGWGKMRVKNLNGQASAYMDVLAVKVKQEITDSFFLAGLPMDVSLLDAVGATQGLVTTKYQIRYYREGEVTPLLEVDYMNDTYLQEDGARAHMKRLPAGGSSVGTVSGKENKISIFPNPVINRSINIHIGEAGNHTWGYELINLAGQKIAGGALMLTGNKSEVLINAALAPGMYTVNVLKNGTRASAQVLVIQ
jgi:hypothetical protein